LLRTPCCERRLNRSIRLRGGIGSRTLGTQTRNPLGITRICDRDCGVSRGFDSSGSLRFIPSPRQGRGRVGGAGTAPTLCQARRRCARTGDSGRLGDFAEVPENSPDGAHLHNGADDTHFAVAAPAFRRVDDKYPFQQVCPGEAVRRWLSYTMLPGYRGCERARDDLRSEPGRRREDAVESDGVLARSRDEGQKSLDELERREHNRRLPSENGRLKRSMTRPSASWEIRSVARRPSQVPRRCSSPSRSLAAMRTAACRLNPSTTTQRRPVRSARLGEIPDPMRAGRVPRRIPVAPTCATEAPESAASSGSSAASASLCSSERAPTFFEIFRNIPERGNRSPIVP
jgi:hypothetical protein